MRRTLDATRTLAAVTGTTYEHTFPDAGTFPYFCQPHASFGMTGRVVVAP